MGTYFITGATGGIGAAVAELLYERGHSLIITGRSPERLDEAVQALVATPAAQPTREIRVTGPHRDLAPRVRTIVLDLAEPQRLEAALAETDVSTLDGVVHCAGVVGLGTVEELQADDWTGQLLVNVAAPAELTRLLLPALRAAKGEVVFVNSGSGLRAKPGWSAYAASKHALRALADSLRAEEPALRVTSVFPGRTASEMQRKVRAQENGEYDPTIYMSAATVASVIVNAMETPRDATVTEISVRTQS